MLSGCRHQAVGVIPLLGPCRQDVFVRLSSSGHRRHAIIVRCCQVVIRPLFLGCCCQAIISLLSSGRCCLAVIVRPSSSGHHYPLLSSRRQVVVVRLFSSGRCCLAVVVRSLSSGLKNMHHESATRNLIGNAKMRSPTYFLSFIPLQIRLNLLKNL